MAFSLLTRGTDHGQIPEASEFSMNSRSCHDAQILFPGESANPEDHCVNFSTERYALRLRKKER